MAIARQPLAQQRAAQRTQARRARRNSLCSLPSLGEPGWRVARSALGLVRCLRSHRAVELAGHVENRYDADARSDSPFLAGLPPTGRRELALDLNLLLIHDQPVAFNYAYHYRGYVFGLRTGFDPRRPRKAPARFCKRHMIEDCFARGDRTYDLGPGYLGCKRHWQTSVRASYRYTHFPRVAPIAQLARSQARHRAAVGMGQNAGQQGLMRLRPRMAREPFDGSIRRSASRYSDAAGRSWACGSGCRDRPRRRTGRPVADRRTAG